MENRIAGKRLREYNRLFWESDGIYRQAIRDLGLTETVFWIFYALRADGEGSERLTQSEIGRILFLPKQTLNSALKKLKGAGMVEMLDGADRRSKYILLTPKGKELAHRTVDRLIEVENATFAQLSEAEQEALLGTMRLFTERLGVNAGKLAQRADKGDQTEENMR